MASRRVLGVLALLVGLYGSRIAIAGAAAPAAAPAAAAVKTEARERFDRGLNLFEKGEHAAALAEFKRAFELIPNPVVLYNMGLVYAAMNRPVEAVDALDRFYAATGDKATVEQKHQGGKVRAEQAARIARLMVVTNHPSTVELDGVEAGHTPMTEPLAVPSGAHTITAIAPGFQPSRREVTLAGQVTETVSLALVPTETGAAHLAVTTPVPGAEVWINDKRVGVTPLLGTVAVAPGEVRIELRRDGYLSSSKAMHIDEGANARVDLSLDEDPAATSPKGRLRLALSVSGSTEIAVDGTPRGNTADGLSLPAGPHTLRVDCVGFEPYNRSIQIDPGRDLALAVSLVPTLETQTRDEDSARTRRIVGWSMMGGGVATAVGAAAYAILTRHDVSQAQASLNDQLAKEQNTANLPPTSRDPCYDGPDRMPNYYEGFGCGAIKAGLQNQVDSAKLKRVLAWSGVGVGAIAAGIGGYLLATSGAARGVGGTRVGLWTTGKIGGLTLFSTF